MLIIEKYKEWEEKLAKPTLVNELAEVFANTKYEDLPEDLVWETKRMILDTVGCAISGLTNDKGKGALRIGRKLFAGDDAHVFGAGDKLSLMGAAFVNSDCANACDNAIVCPPGHVVEYYIPAAIAQAEVLGSSGKDLITAVALGMEMTHRIGNGMAYHRDIDPVTNKLKNPRVSGFASAIFGGAATIGKLRGFDKELIADALGIAAWISPINGMRIWGSHITSAVKYLSGGMMGLNVISAAEMAEQGYGGDRLALEDDGVSWPAMIGTERWDPSGILPGFGKTWLFPNMQSYKLYPSCRNMASPCDLTLKLVTENDIKPEEILEINVWGEQSSLAGPAWVNYTPEKIWDACVSTPHTIALTACGVAPGPEWYDAHTLRDPMIEKVRLATNVFEHPDYIEKLKENGANRPTKVEIKTARGVFTAESMRPRGNNVPPEVRMNEPELYEKYRTNTERFLTIADVEASIDAIMRLEEFDDINDVVKLLHI